MTTPPPPRPGQPGWQGGAPRRGQPPQDPATRRIPRRRPEPPTEQFRPPSRPQGPPPRQPDADPTERLRRPQSPADYNPTEELYRRPPPPPLPPSAPPEAAAPPPKERGGLLRSRQSLALIALIVVATLVGGLAGAELYARSRADSILVEVAECVVEDGVTISFGVNPPFLWQHITGHYTNISVVTAGDRVQSADGMTADVTLRDIRLQETADAKGTIGALQATLTWRSEGIKDTVAANLPGIGNLVTGVRTDAAAGTIILDAGEYSVTAKPVVIDGDLDLEVLEVDGPLPKDTVQSALDDLTKKLNDNYPLGIHADSVEVTGTGVVGTFSSHNAAIPKDDENPCFARL